MVDLDRMYALFGQYWSAMGLALLRRATLETNMADEHRRRVFEDVLPLLAPGVQYVPNDAYARFTEAVLPLFPI